jgi:hypothetical protein
MRLCRILTQQLREKEPGIIAPTILQQIPASPTFGVRTARKLFFHLSGDEALEHFPPPGWKIHHGSRYPAIELKPQELEIDFFR